MQVLYHRLTNHAKNCLDNILSKNNLPFEKINGALLLWEIKKENGSLGSLIIKNLDIVEKLKKNKMEIKIPLSEVLLRSFKSALFGGQFLVGTDNFVYSFLSILIERDPSLSKKILPLNKLDKNSLQNKEMPNFHPNNFNNSGLGKNIPPEFFGEINTLINSFLFPTQRKNTSEEFLKNFCLNLSLFSKKQAHTLIGRKKELERISNILGRKMKNNPVLVGDPGVGKTAIVEGLAQQINQNKAPFFLGGKTIYSLDLGLLVAGTNFRGEFEARLKEIIGEAKQNKNVILFIDEIHNLVGAGNAVGGMDAANLMKPALSRGEMQIIGATTSDEYYKYIEKDSALERRFQPVFVNEPTPKETIQILLGIREGYEKYHNLKIDDTAVYSATHLAKRYLTNRFLPDSAIDLIDESSAEMRSRLTNGELYHHFEKQKNLLKKIITQKENLVISNQYEEAISLRQEEVSIRKDLKKIQQELEKIAEKKCLILKEKDIQKTLSKTLNIPLEYLSKKNNNLPKQIIGKLKKNLFGQNHTIKKIENSLLRQYSGISNPDRPLGSFLFVGPSGVGKTLTAKIISSAMSPDSQNNLIQINMSEFMEKHSLSRLLGAPAGYVGYEEKGELLDKIRHNPHSVVLFDEVEKADQNVLNILLQILEEGKIANAKGQIIDFKNSIVILTSNIGNERLNEISRIGFQQGEKKAKQKLQSIKENIKKELEEILPLELINRLDEVIIFNHLEKKDLEKIVGKEMKSLKNKLSAQKIALEYDKKIEKIIANLSADPDQGARLVKKQIKEIIEPIVAKEIIKIKKLKQKSVIKLTSEKNKIILEKKKMDKKNSK